ncbi:MAG: hypothetical protein IJB52_13230 [Clostridia bacterium]|nr:hypothetical protein [Clostridia bacterium]
MVSREFDGDLLVTDPMYVMQAGDDWGRSEYGFRMEELGVRTYLTAETLMGDWDCRAYDAVSGKEIGRFCSDSGLVSVFRMEEILQYNPAYKEHLIRPFTAAWIRDFRGTVQFTVRKTNGTLHHGAGHKPDKRGRNPFCHRTERDPTGRYIKIQETEQCTTHCT